jgi:hypothetical protein
MLIRLRRTPLSESACALLASVIQGYDTTSRNYVFLIRFEDLVARTEAVMRRVAEFLQRKAGLAIVGSRAEPVWTKCSANSQS